MRIVIDSFAVLKAIGSNPSAFGAVDELVRKHSSALLVARFKHRSLNLNDFRAICGALGLESAQLFFDNADAALLKAVCKKCDQHAPELKAGDIEAIKRHLLALANGKEGADKPTKTAPKPPKLKATKCDMGGNLPHAIATKPPK